MEVLTVGRFLMFAAIALTLGCSSIVDEFTQVPDITPTDPGDGGQGTDLDAGDSAFEG
jgi:hypothetical protein